MHGCRCRLHLLVKLDLGGGYVAPELRLSRPKPLPIERPIGPQRPGIAIDWGRWEEVKRFEDYSGGTNGTAALTTWFAGAEAELTTKYGLARTEEESAVLGLGCKSKEVWCHPRGRFRDVPDELGILGHRLALAAKALRMVAVASEAAERGDEVASYLKQTLATAKRRPSCERSVARWVGQSTMPSNADCNGSPCLPGERAATIR